MHYSFICASFSLLNLTHRRTHLQHCMRPWFRIENDRLAMKSLSPPLEMANIKVDNFSEHEDI